MSASSANRAQSETAARLLVDWLARRHLAVERVVETHISVLAFTADKVYKVKKPVAFAFCDLSSASARAADARREVDLNSRLAADVYLGLEPITDLDGEELDTVVVMRRLNDEHRLRYLAEAGQGRSCVRAVAEQMARFHAELGPSPLGARVASRDAVRDLWRAGFDQWRSFRGEILDESTVADVEAMTDRYLAGRDRLFRARLGAGHVRDGHGDLLADDIFCEPDGPRIIDCLEFDESLRCGDTLLDLAFLAMDLEAIGRPDLASDFLAHARDLSHDPWPASLAHHYVAYRAHVRAKIACLRAEQGDAGAAREAAARLALCHEHLRRGRVRLALVGGLPGTGKSTVAHALGESVGAVVIRSDVVRKECLGIEPNTAQPADYGEGIYSEAQTAATYEAMLREAGDLLVLGHSVVLDASWSSRQTRRLAASLADRTSADLVELCCEAPAPLCRARVRERGRAGVDPSDATPAIRDEMEARFTPWPHAASVLTTETRDDALAVARTLFDA